MTGGWVCLDKVRKEVTMGTIFGPMITRQMTCLFHRDKDVDLEEAEKRAKDFATKYRFQLIILED